MVSQDHNPASFSSRNYQDFSVEWAADSSEADVNVLQLFRQHTSWQQVALFLLCMVVLLRTMAPSVYELDSAELATGAATLGIVHSPGYPLYTMVAHLFTLLPLGDVGFRVNLLSVLCLALTAPIVYSFLGLLVGDKRIAVVTTLMFVWSFFIWDTGTAAEIYAPQLLTLAMCAWSLARMYRDWQQAEADPAKGAIRTGAFFGLAAAISPTSVLLAPGLGLAFIFMRVPWRKCLFAGLISIVIFASTLLYFPLRYGVQLQFNKIGHYQIDGSFQSADFSTLDGIWGAISGREFGHLFFANGYLPTFRQLAQTISWLWSNYLGVGMILGLIGGVYLFKKRRALFFVWLASFLPYTYFYTTYGASDRNTMFGPSYLVWVVLIAFGLKVVFSLPRFVPYAKLTVLVLPAIFFMTNFQRVDLSGWTATRTYAEAVLDSIPPNAVVVGYWREIAPLQYLHFAEGQRPDVKIYDLFLFDRGDFHRFVDITMRLRRSQVIVVTNQALSYLIGTSYGVAPLLVQVGDENTFTSFALNFEVAMADDPE